LSPTKLVMYK